MLRRELLDALERRARGPRSRRRPGTPSRPVLGLRRQLELDDARLGIRSGEHDDLGRSCRKVDCDVPRDEELRLVHVRAARPADLVDARSTRLRTRAPRSPAGRRPPRPRRGRELAPPRRPTGALGRRDDHDPLDPGDAPAPRT